MKFSNLFFLYRCLTYYLPYFHYFPLLPFWKHSGNWGKMVSSLHLLRPTADYRTWGYLSVTSAEFFNYSILGQGSSYLFVNN